MKSKVISCPDHLCKEKQHFIERVTIIDNEYIATLSHLGGIERKVLIQKDAYEAILQLWQNDHTALLELGSSTIREDNVMLPSHVNVSEDLTDEI